MSSDWNTLDRQAPIPYVRDKAKKAYEVPVGEPHRTCVHPHRIP